MNKVDSNGPRISGSDTTACAVRSALAHIITSPLLYTSLLSEATSFLTTTPLPASSIITNAQAQSLPLLQATLKEALRIWPPIHGVMPRVSKFDATICGVRIPAGTNVCWSSCAVLRNREVFGEDAEVFRAERWLTADKERLAGMDNIFDLTFGWGRWGCLGRGIAMVEMGKVVFEVSRGFPSACLERLVKKMTANEALTDSEEVAVYGCGHGEADFESVGGNDDSVGALGED